MWGRLLCWLGVQDWQDHYLPDRPGMIYERCRRCGETTGVWEDDGWD